MVETQQALRKRLLFILHRGFVETRNLALSGGNHQQVADLADAMELLPRFVERCNDEELELIRFVLRTYQDKYPQTGYDHLSYLDRYDPPERY
jgi:hypothetical protein